MSNIIKTEAVVLNKINYGDSSNIVTLFTKDFGKISAIIKGGRNPKSKIGLVADPLNHLQIVMYKKDSREIQIISSIDLITYFAKIREDFEKLKYAFAVIELVKKLTVENEKNLKLFKGLIRILTLFNVSQEKEIIIFGRFFIFLLSERGYEMQLNKCSICGTTDLSRSLLSYNFERGILCGNCRKNHIESFPLSAELFEYMFCLKNNQSIENKINYETMERAILFLEKYLNYHVPDFKGIQSFQIFK